MRVGIQSGHIPKIWAPYYMYVTTVESLTGIFLPLLFSYFYSVKVILLK